MKLEADDAIHIVGAVDLGANLLQFGKSLGDLEALLFHQVHARQTHHHRTPLPRITVSGAFGVAVGNLRTLDEIFRLPVGRR